MSKARQKAQDLVRLATDSDTDKEEALTAAYRACKIIEKYDLLSSPLDGLLGSGNETVEAAASIFETLTSPKLAGNLKKIAGAVGQARRRRR